MRNLKRILWPTALLSLAFVQASADPGLNAEKLPTSWYTKPEDVSPMGIAALVQAEKAFSKIEAADSGATSRPLAQGLDEPGEEAGHQFERVLAAPAAVMNRVSESALTRTNPPEPPGHPKDWVPWRMTFFTTELAVSIQGLLGLLTARGTPQVIAMWRKQGPVVSKPIPPAASVANLEATRMAPLLEDSNSIPVTANDNTEDLLEQMEPTIQAAVAAGSLREGPELRKNLRGVAARLQEMVQGLESAENPGTQWWVSSCRFDLLLDVTGRLGMGPTAGVETRLRFDWRRLKRNRSSARATQLTRLASNLQNFATMMAQDLEATAENTLNNSGYEAFGYRMGFGVSVRGDIGLVTGTAQVMGHLFFTRDVKAPELRPQLAVPPEYVMLEHAPPPAHLQAAESFGIPVERISLNDAQYRVTRKRLRKGLGKAAKIASYFVRHAHASSQPQSSGWKTYILRLFFDWSLTGDAGLVAIGGQPTTEILFYNRNF